MSETVIKVENLGKKFKIGAKGHSSTLRDSIVHFFKNRKIQKNEFWALKNINFEVQKGEVLGIIGPNGAGKSTLLKILSQITPPTTGKITVNGRIASLLEVGTGFHPELTGRENIYLNGAILGMTHKEIKSKFDDIVAFSEIDKFLDTPVKRYSSGMYVRLAFAVAAHLEPEILIIDEVLSVGDANFQKKCLGKMENVSKTGRTVLFVSHNMAAVKSLCHRAILLQKGKIAAIGKVGEVIQRYLGGVISNEVLEKIWLNANQAPQNHSIILEKVRICDDSGKVVRRINTDDSFNVEISYKVKANNSFVGLNVVFFDNEDNCIFPSLNNHEKNWYGKPMPKGRYKSICKIPKNLLNNITYEISIFLFGKNFSDFVMTKDVLKLEVQEGIEVRGDYFGGYDAKLRPLFCWETFKTNK